MPSKKHQLGSEISSIEQNYQTSPHIYNNYLEYLFTLIGYTAGLGSFWRFPYLIYKNGGGTFFIPYLLAMTLIAVPFFYFETVLGQTQRASLPVILARVHPGLKVLGLTFIVILLNEASYYNMLLAYSWRYLFVVFEKQIPFQNQSIEDNTYFTQTLLQKSDSIEEFGGINWNLLVLYIFSMVLCFFVVKNGIKVSGKVTVFTAIAPYVLLLVLACKGMFLEGARLGLKQLFIPDFSKLLSFSIWTDAVTQAFYQTGLGVSVDIAYASMNPKQQRIFPSPYLVIGCIVLCGTLSATIIYLYLGHYCFINGIEIADLALYGFELSFNVFPKVLLTLPWPRIWLFIFFLALVFLGIDTQFGTLEGIFCYLKDEFTVIKERKICGFTLNQKKMQIVVIVLATCPGVLLASSAGIHYVEFIDFFAIVLPLSISLLAEHILFFHYFNFESIHQVIERYTGESCPTWILTILESKGLLGVLSLNLIFAFYSEFTFSRKYSLIFALLGWLLSLWPYLLAYLQFMRHREEDWCLDHKALKKRRADNEKSLLEEQEGNYGILLEQIESQK